MPRGRPLKALEVSQGAREELQSLVRSRSLPAGLVRRAEIVLLCADGLDNQAVAERVRTSRQTVGKWRERFRTQGLMGLYDERKPGRPRSIEDDELMTLLQRTLETQPPGGRTHWTCRTMADATGISKSAVHRLWRAFNIQPHRQKHFKLSTDPFFAEKVRDIVGLYLNPPDHAMVLCVDEKSQTQALERTQPLLPLGLGYVEGVTHGYIRHGTTTLFAALDVATGRVLAQCKARHRHQEFLSFLKHIDANVPPIWTSTSSSTTTAPTSMPRSSAGSRPGLATTSTSPPPTPPGSTRSRSGSTSSPRRPSAAAPSPRSPSSRRRSSASPTTTTTQARSPSCGLPPQTPSFRRSRDYVQLSLGHDTSRPRTKPLPRDLRIRGTSKVAAVVATLPDVRYLPSLAASPPT